MEWQIYEIWYKEHQAEGWHNFAWSVDDVIIEAEHLGHKISEAEAGAMLQRFEDINPQY